MTKDTRTEPSTIATIGRRLAVQVHHVASKPGAGALLVVAAVAVGRGRVAEETRKTIW
jgi:hypothetical protein